MFFVRLRIADSLLRVLVSGFDGLRQKYASILQVFKNLWGFKLRQNAIFLIV
jgi:hypothetical protein